VEGNGSFPVFVCHLFRNNDIYRSLRNVYGSETRDQ
jgi:hypothetical protein